MIRLPTLPLVACAAALCAGAATAVPITVTNAGYWLETVGTNPLGIAAGGPQHGTVTTLFVANTSPDINGGTTAVASQNGFAAGAVGVDGVLWARRVLNPTAAQLTPLTVTFANGADRTPFVGRDLSALSPMPLVEDANVDGAVNPSSPLVTWTLPAAAAAGDVDFVQLVFYDNATNGEIGSRVTLAPTATSYRIVSTLPVGLDLVVNVRLVDLYDDTAAFTFGNIQRMSRSYSTYVVPVPEPGTAVMAALGLVALAWRLRRRAPR